MADNSAGQIGLDLVLNQNQFDKQMKGIQGLAKKAGAALASAFAVKKVVDFGAQCIELGSDLQEVQNVVDVTFPKLSKQIDAFAQNAAASFGLSETMAKRFTGTFGAMAKAFGFSESAAYEMSTTLTGLAGDVASFYNLSQDEAYTKLKAVFTGETESLKDLGIVMTQTALDSYALANGFGKTTANMSEAEKVALRYKFVQEQLSGAAGDFLRTSDGWANQVRVLKLQFDSLKASIGQGLINILTPVLQLINTLLSKLLVLGNAFKAFSELITGKKGATTQASIVAEDAANASDELGGVAAAAAKAKKAASSSGIDELNIINPTTESDTESENATPKLDSEVDFGTLAEGETVLDSMDAKLQGIFDRLQTSIQPAKDSLSQLWDEGLAKLKDFSSTGLQDFYNEFLVPVGEWTLGEGIPRFIDAINNGLKSVDWETLNSSLHNLWDKLAPFAENVGEGLLWLWENVLVPFGAWVANEVVPRFLDTISGALESANKIIEAVKPHFEWLWDEVLEPIADWAADAFLKAWDRINDALQKFSDWCAENPETIQTIATIIGALATAFAVVSTVMTAVSVISGILGAAFTFITSPIGLITIAVGALIAAGVMLYQNWEEIKRCCSDIWAAIKELIAWAIESIQNWIVTKIETIKTAWLNTWQAIGDFFSGIWNGIKTTVSNIFTAIWKFICSTAESIRSAWEKSWDTVRSFFAGIWEKLSETVSIIFNKIRQFISTTLSAIKEKFTTVWNGIKTTVTTVITGVKTAISNVMSSIKTGISTALTAIKSKFTSIFTSIKDTVTTLFSGMWNGIKGIINSILGGIEGMANGVVRGVNRVIGALNSLSFDIPDWIPGFGGETFGFSIPTMSEISIPRLAQGGFIPANTPRLAMIGDNRTQGEIVSPEDKLQEMAYQAAMMASQNNLTGQYLQIMIELLRQIIERIENLDLVVNIDIRELRKKLKDLEKRSGYGFSTT